MWLTLLMRLSIAVTAFAVLLNGWFSMNLHNGEQLSESILQGIHSLFSCIIWSLIAVLLLAVFVRCGVNSGMTRGNWIALSGCFLATAIVALAVTSRMYQRNLPAIELSALTLWATMLPSAVLVFIAVLEWKVALRPVVGVAVLLLVIIVGLGLSWTEIIRVVAPGLYRPPLQSHDLSYPILRIHDKRTIEIVANEDALATMSSDDYMNRKADPILIDSNFTIVQQSNLKMVGSEVTLMVTGPRSIQVQFQLVTQPQSGDKEHAKGMLLQCSSFDPDMTKDGDIRSQISSAETLREVIDAIR